jgi:hypothetical protein
MPNRKTLTQLMRPSLLAVCLLLAFSTLLPLLNQGRASAAGQITARKLTLSTSSPAASAATTTYTFNFTLPSATVVKGFEVVVCTTASGACTTPSGFANSSSTLASQPTNLGDASGWTVSTATAGKLRISKSGNVAAPTGSQTVVFGNVQNPTTANQTLFGRITTYTDAAWTGGNEIDSGIVAASTAQQITLTGTMDESLVFCTGTSITGTNCGTVAGSSVAFGTFDSTAAKTGTSVMAASTNGGSGYAITINGTTLTCAACPGTPTIAALSSQTASSAGSAQFGLNLLANTSPATFGANPSGSGSGNYTANYGTTNQYRFVTGDSVAAAAGATNANAFTSSYIVNVPGSQAAGTYAATMTYIATATF